MGSDHSTTHAWRRTDWIVAAALAVTAFALGFWGLLQWAPVHLDHGDSLRVRDIAYLTLNLFTLESFAILYDANLPLQIAQFLAPAALAYAAIRGVVLLLGERAAALRLMCLRGHVIVCGLGEKGRRLAYDLLRARRRVVVIENDASNALIEDLRARGVIVLAGNAASAPLLARARVQRAAALFAVCRSDDANLGTALAAYGLKCGDRDGDRGPKLVCHVHLRQHELLDQVRALQVVKNIPGRFELHYFNISAATAARQLLREHPPHARRKPGEHEPIRLLVVGLEEMGQALVTQAARVCHYARNRQTEIVVLPAPGGASAESFLARQPGLASVPNVKVNFIRTDTATPLFVQAAALATGTSFDGIFVCLEDEARALITALHIESCTAGQDVPVLVQAHDQSPFHDLQCPGAASAGGPASRIHAFGLSRHVCTHDNVTHERIDRLARGIHEAYLTDRLLRGASGRDNPAHVPWDSLSEEFRDANREQADHVEVKLWSAGCRVRKATAVPPPVCPEWPGLSPEQLDELAQMEHNRWAACKCLAGWSYAPVRNDATRQHDLLVPWEQLSEEARDVDRLAIRAIPGHLARLGLEIERGDRPVTSAGRSATVTAG